MEKLLTVQNLSAFYETKLGEKIYGVDQVSLSLEKGKILGIAGESGCGKSTLALSLTGYFAVPLHYLEGRAMLHNESYIPKEMAHTSAHAIQQKVAYVPQAAMNTLNPTLKIKKLLYDIVHQHQPTLKKAEIYALALDHFQQLGLDVRVLDAYPHQLSGGMKQRTVIALATILNPTLLIADEPTSALDVTSQKKVVGLLKKLITDKRIEGMIFITHELPLLYHIADDIAVMYAGQIVEYGPKGEVMNTPYHPYTKALMDSVVTATPGIKQKELIVLEGAPPDLKKRELGCRFYGRCPYREAKCQGDSILLKEKGHRKYRCIRQEEK